MNVISTRSGLACLELAPSELKLMAMGLDRMLDVAGPGQFEAFTSMQTLLMCCKVICQAQMGDDIEAPSFEVEGRVSTAAPERACSTSEAGGAQ